MKALRFLALAIVAAATILTASSWKCCRQRERIVLLETNMGSIKVKLYNETPLHRDNFIKQVKAHNYDSSTFHRVIKDFMIQGGKPKYRDEDDEPALIPAEFRLEQDIYHRRGVLAAARTGDKENPERASSPYQFYITVKPTAWLDGKYTVFGEVLEGMEIVDAISLVETDGRDRPLEPVVILSAKLKRR